MKDFYTDTEYKRMLDKKSKQQQQVILKDSEVAAGKALASKPKVAPAGSLEYCSFCGATSVQPHRKYQDRCVVCGERYTRYATYKSLQKSDPTPARAAHLAQLIIEYQNLKKAGYKVPRDI